jgi:hypothetical protein
LYKGKAHIESNDFPRLKQVFRDDSTAAYMPLLLRQLIHHAKKNTFLAKAGNKDPRIGPLPLVCKPKNRLAPNLAAAQSKP